jgi:hypothetical protein
LTASTCTHSAELSFRKGWNTVSPLSAAKADLQTVRDKATASATVFIIAEPSHKGAPRCVGDILVIDVDQDVVNDISVEFLGIADFR